MIGELFESICYVMMEGILSLDRILKFEFEDVDRVFFDALELSGSVMVLLFVYVFEVECLMEDVNVWFMVFEIKLVNMCRNIEIIKGRDDKRDVFNENKRAFVVVVRGLFGELELFVGVECVVCEYLFDDE